MLRSLTLAVFAAALASLSVRLADVAIAAPPPDGAVIVRGAGRMRGERAADWSPTVIGTVIASGTIVDASGAGQLEIKFSDGVEVTMEPGATAVWRGRGRLPTEHNGWYGGFHIEQRAGEIDVKIPSQPVAERAFLISSKAGTLTGWRGSVHVLVHDDTTAAAIYEGALVVGSNGIGFPVYDATAVLIRKGVAPEKSRGIPSTPAWPAETPAGTTPPLALVKANERAPLGFAWSKVEGAATYRLEVSTDPVMVNVIQRATTADTSFVVGEVPAGGRYYVRVRAVGADGIVGGWSRPRPLRVIRVAYPRGAFVAKDGTVILPENATIVLTDAEGIEVAYENVGGPKGTLAWARAPNNLGLGSSGSRIVHLRDPALGAETRMVLGRRELRAKVDLCPRRARWPEDPVSVKVIVADPSGRIDPSAELLTFETTVNLEPVPLVWHHIGATWWATLAPRPAPGPWIVRVTARDSGGVEIGEGHLEVDGAPPPKTRQRGVDTTEVKVTR